MPASAAFAAYLPLCPTDREAGIFQQWLEADVRMICEEGPLGVENRAICCTRDAAAEFVAVINGRIAQGLFDGRGGACLPFYLLAPDDGVRHENITDAAMDRFRAHYHDPAISKWSIFDYVYGLLHHARYRTRFAKELARDLPRIPFAPDFRAFQRAGQKLIELHANLEALAPWPLKPIDGRVSVPTSGAKRGSKVIRVSDSLSLGDVPALALKYHLGDRSALEWLIDRDRATLETRDPQDVVCWAGQVVRASIETIEIIDGLPAKFA